MLDSLVPFNQLLWFQKVSIFIFDLFFIFALIANNFETVCNNFGHIHPWFVELINFNLHTWLHNPLHRQFYSISLTVWCHAEFVAYLCLGESVLQKCFKFNFSCVCCTIWFWYMINGSFDIYQCFFCQIQSIKTYCQLHWLLTVPEFCVRETFSRIYFVDSSTMSQDFSRP